LSVTPFPFLRERVGDWVKKIIMDNLDFGLGFSLMILAVMTLIYCLIVWVNYGLILWIGNGIKRLLKKTIWKEKTIFSIFNLMSIYLPIALFLQFGISEGLIFLILNDNGQIEFINSFSGSFFTEVLLFFTGWIGSLEIVGMILLRQIYNQNWSIINKESWKKRIGKIWLLLFLLLGIRLFFRAYLTYYYIGNLAIYWVLLVVQILIAIGLIYAMLKRK
jgi:hypothetical protein